MDGKEGQRPLRARKIDSSGEEVIESARLPRWCTLGAAWEGKSWFGRVEKGEGMSLLARAGGGRRRARRAAALTFAGALFAFQALALIGAPVASAATCTFSGGTLSIVLTVGEVIEFSANDSDDIFINGADSIAFACGATRATLANTTAISVTGFTGDEEVTIWTEYFGATTDLIPWGAINWTINLASGTGDLLIVDTSVTPEDIDIALGASGIDLNNDGDLDVTVAATEDVEVFTDAGDDVIWGAGSTATGGPFALPLTADGFGGDDTLASGASDDDLDGGTGGEVSGDTIDFSGAAAGVNVNLLGGVATGMGSDILSGFENIVGSGFNDSLTGDTGDNDIAPGAGDDTVAGGDGFDWVDYFDAAAAVTVDMTANTATGGSGNDALGSAIEGAVGSDNDDTFLDQTNQDNEYFGGAGGDMFSQGTDPAAGDEDLIDGEGGVDTADYSARTEAVQVDLEEDDDATDALCDDDSGDLNDGEDDFLEDVENANLGSGDDTVCGSAFQNTVQPGDGQNVLDGFAGSDTLDYSAAAAGVEVNLAGGATAGDSATNFENVTGSEFNDTITGNDLSNLVRARNGADNVTGGGGDDTLKGAGGNDALRGGTGDDNLVGAAGNDSLFGGKGTDFCKGGKGNDTAKGCEAGKV
jgi:hypothetical protein